MDRLRRLPPRPGLRRAVGLVFRSCRYCERLAGDLHAADAGRRHAAALERRGLYTGYRDGYEVRYSTTGTAPANFLAHPPLLTVANEAPVWTSHELSLAALAGTPIHIAFRNPSNDKYVLALDDIYVGPRPGIDAAIDRVVATSIDYSIVPAFFSMPFDLGAQVRNAGSMSLANVTASAQTFAAGEPVDDYFSAPVASLAPNGTSNLPLGSGRFDRIGDWTVETGVTAAGSDGDPGNATRADRLMTVSASELRYADRRGEAFLSLVQHAEYGQDFILLQDAHLTGVTIVLIDDGSNAAFFDVYAALYRWDEATRQLGEYVGAAYATPEVEGGVMVVTLEPAFTPMFLRAGHYMLLTPHSEDYKLVPRDGRTLWQTNWKGDFVPAGLSMSTLEETYPDFTSLTWDFTLLLEQPPSFADGFE